MYIIFVILVVVLYFVLCDTLEEEEEEEEDLIKMVECRICQEDDTLQNLDIPCACSGTLKVFLY